LLDGRGRGRSGAGAYRATATAFDHATALDFAAAASAALIADEQAVHELQNATNRMEVAAAARLTATSRSAALGSFAALRSNAARGGAALRSSTALGGGAALRFGSAALRGFAAGRLGTAALALKHALQAGEQVDVLAAAARLTTSRFFTARGSGARGARFYRLTARRLAATTAGFQAQEAIQQFATEPLGREGRAQYERTNQSFAVHSSNNSLYFELGDRRFLYSGGP